MISADVGDDFIGRAIVIFSKPNIPYYFYPLLSNIKDTILVRASIAK